MLSDPSLLQHQLIFDVQSIQTLNILFGDKKLNHLN